MHNNLLIIAEGEDLTNTGKLMENSAINKINEYLKKFDLLPLIHLENSYKNGIFNRDKVFTMDIYAGAYKFSFGENFEKFIKTLKWTLPETVVIIYSDNEMGTNNIYRPSLDLINGG